MVQLYELIPANGGLLFSLLRGRFGSEGVPEDGEVPVGSLLLLLLGLLKQHLGLILEFAGDPEEVMAVPGGILLDVGSRTHLSREEAAFVEAILPLVDPTLLLH